MSSPQPSSKSHSTSPLNSNPVFRVLLVEDSPSDQVLVQEILAQQSEPRFAVDVVATLAECLAHLETTTVDGLLLDVSLPDADRLDSCDRIVEAFPEVPIIVLTGSEDSVLAVAALQRGAQDHLSKRNIDGDLIARSLRYAAERKRIAFALKDSESRYRALVDAMTSMVWHANANGDFDGDNQEWLRFTSQTKSLANGDGWLIPFHAEDVSRIQKTWQEACALANKFETTGRLWHTASQSYREVEMRAVPLKTDRGEVRQWIGQLTDVEETRRTELEMRRSQRLVSLGTFAAGIAHEVNNPLGAAQLSAQAALANLDVHPDRLRDCLDNVVVSLGRCGTIMQNILSFVRTGSNESVKQPLDTIVNHAISLSKGYASNNDATLSVQMTEPPPEAIVNAIEAEQVLLNLIRNAIHSSDGHVNVTVRCNYGENGNARLIVQDDGDGIPEDLQESILDPFFTTRRPGAGTGLGLSIVHGIVREHGGRIDFQSTPGEGTEFVVELPV